MDYKPYLNLALRYTRNRETAEDILQSAALNYHTSNTTPDNPAAYFKQCLFTAYLQHKAKCITQSKFACEEAAFNYQILTASHEQSDFTELYRAITRLTPGQRLVISHVLTGAALGEYDGNYNTTKAQYRNALLELRKGLAA